MGASAPKETGRPGAYGCGSPGQLPRCRARQLGQSLEKQVKDSQCGGERTARFPCAIRRLYKKSALKGRRTGEAMRGRGERREQGKGSNRSRRTSQQVIKSPRDSQESSPTPQFKSIKSSALSLLHSPTVTYIHALAFLLSSSFSISFDLKANDEHVSSGFLFTVSSEELNNFSEPGGLLSMGSHRVGHD